MSLLMKGIQHYFGADREILSKAMAEYDEFEADRNRLEFLLEKSYRVIGGPNYWLVNWKDDPVMEGIAPTKREAIDMAMKQSS